MEQSSIVIHKGGREDKYQIYVEDYVLSFLKEETGTLELSEFYFYGFREKNGRKYMIYGAGRNRGLAVFDKYDLLEEVGCRLTQAGPVFLMREENDTKYEIKGYEVFYRDNREMQNYLIDHKRDDVRKLQGCRTERADRETGKFACAGSIMRQGQTVKRAPHNVITVQLGVILVALVAIVINSTNSYDKMQELNQSAEEVFFAMENQEAGSGEKTDGEKMRDEAEADEGETMTAPINDEKVENVIETNDKKQEIVVKRDVVQEENILKLATLENEEQSKEENEGDVAAGQEEKNENAPEEQSEEQRDGDTESQAEAQDKKQEETKPEEVEALSRNVTRYYEVERGDTLYTISQKIYGDTAYVQQICELNQISNPDNIRYGQKIILP